MFSYVKKTFEVKLSLPQKLIDVKHLSKYTSYKTTVQFSNPKDDLQIPKCKSFGIIQNPQDYFLVPEDPITKVHRIHMLQITFALDVDQVSLQKKIEIFELQILTF
jgi:hypothetical protein